MDQDQLRAILRTIIADRAQAGESLADVGRVLAQEINPTRPPFSRQYVHMLANGKTRITEEIGSGDRNTRRHAGRRRRDPGARPHDL